MKIGVFGLPQEYIDRCVDKLGSEFKLLEGKSVTLLGGTGFFGSWISSIFIEAINSGLNLRLNILSRSESEKICWELVDRSKVKFYHLDLGNGIPKEFLKVNFLIFAATSSSPNHGNQDSESISRTSKSFQQAIKDVASANQVESVLHLSSGAVYKKDNNAKELFEENNVFETNELTSYQEAKIFIEKCLIQESKRNPNFKYSSPRLFAFYGPGLPIDAHFAIGNFIGNASKNVAIAVKGNKDTVRSYLHVADASTSLIKILLKPNNLPMNLGSPKGIRLEDLALKVSDMFNLPSPHFNRGTSEFSYYVPSVKNIENWIGEFESIEIEDGIRDWVDWLKFNF